MTAIAAVSARFAAVSARFAAWIPGARSKACPLLPRFLNFSFSPSSLPFSRAVRCWEALGQRVVSRSFNDVLLQRIGDKNVAEEVKNILEMAERCRISIGNSEILTTDPYVVAALSISGNFGFEHCSHGDFLGAIVGTGIVREKVGDILLQGKEGAQVVVVPELVDFLTSALNKVGNVPVTCQQIPLLALKYEPPRTKSFTTVEASLRVDALASAGFNISRSKLVSLISNGDVRLNWSPVMKNGTILKAGDIVSVSGKGRLKIGEIKTTRRGKFSVELIRYL